MTNDQLNAIVQAAFDHRGFVLAAEVVHALPPSAARQIIKAPRQGSGHIPNLAALDAVGNQVPLLPRFYTVGTLGIEVHAWVHVLPERQPSSEAVGIAFAEHLIKSCTTTGADPYLTSHILADAGKRVCEVGPEAAAREAVAVVDELRRQTVDASTLVPLLEGWRWHLNDDGKLFAEYGDRRAEDFMLVNERFVFPPSKRDEVPPEIIDALKAAHTLGPWESDTRIVPKQQRCRASWIPGVLASPDTPRFAGRCQLRSGYACAHQFPIAAKEQT